MGNDARLLPAMAFLIAAGALATGCRHAAAPPSPQAAGPPEVTVAKPERRLIEHSTIQPGRIEAFERTPLFAKVAGYVDSVEVDIGDTVAAGDLLVRIAVPELLDERHEKEALVAQAEAEVKQSESAIAASRAAAETAQARIAEADAGLVRAKADVERWRSEYDRIGELAAKGAITRRLEEETASARDSAVAAVEEAAARGRSARAAAREAEARIAQSEADRVAAGARLDVAHAAVDRIRTMLGYTEIRSPYAGTVTSRGVDTGHFVQPVGGPQRVPLLEVASTDRVRVFVEVPELEAGQVDVGDPAEVRVQAADGEIIRAAVTRTSGALLEQNHALRVEIDVPNAEHRLRPGMYATVTIRLEERPQALVIPVTAVVRDGASTVCCVVRDDAIERRPIELGLRSAGFVEVLSGLDDDALVVTRQPDRLKDGQGVRVASGS